MKSILYILLAVGVLVLAVSKELRMTAMNVVQVAASSIKQLTFRGDQAEIRTIKASEFDSVITEPGRIVVVVIGKKLTTESTKKRHELEDSLRELPSKVLFAKVVAEGNASLLNRLNIAQLPNVRIYIRGKMVGGFKGRVDKNELIKTIQYHLDNPNVKVGRESGYIGPIDDGWRPPGISKSAKSKPRPMTRLE